MKTYIWAICMLVAAFALSGCSNTSAAKARTLTCDGGTFSQFRLTNVNERSYTSMGQTCRLTNQAEGVIWVASGEGYAMADAGDKLVFKDEQDRQLRYTCWTTSGTINGVPKTELILFGPSDSKRVSVCCGDACADAMIE